MLRIGGIALVVSMVALGFYALRVHPPALLAKALPHSQAALVLERSPAGASGLPLPRPPLRLNPMEDWAPSPLRSPSAEEEKHLWRYNVMGLRKLEQGDFDGAADEFNSSIVIYPQLNGLAALGLMASEKHIKRLHWVPVEPNDEVTRRDRVATLFQLADIYFRLEQFADVVAVVDSLSVIHLESDAEILTEAANLRDRAEERLEERRESNR